jgi:ABC-2 type transport system ATP-binding protein
MNAQIIQAQNLVKWYGPRLAVRDVSFSVGEGEVVGLLGPNGSGKSTIFRILTGYIAPSSGTAVVAGHDTALESLELRQVVSYVPEDAPLYDYMRVEEFLRFMAQLKGLSGHEVAARVGAVAERLQLGKVINLLIGKLSRGYRQRVSIAQALLNEPKLLILDEPTSGLDPSQVIVVRDLIRELAGKQTVLIASHVLSEVELISNRVMILLDGRLLTTDALADGAATQRLRLQVVGAEGEVRACIGAVAGVHSIALEPGSEAGTVRYVVEADKRPRFAQEVAAALVSRGFALSELASVPPDLERIFLDLTRRPQEAAA